MEATTLLEKHALSAFTETWWDDSHNDYKMFRRHRRGWRRGEAALYIKKGIESEELSLKIGPKQIKSLQVRLRDRGNKGSLVVSVYYRLSDQVVSDSTSHRRNQDCKRLLFNYSDIS